jgi:hypothetical protein
MTSSIIGADQARYNCKYSLNGSQFAMTAKAAQDRSTVSFIQLQAVFTYKIASSKQANVCPAASLANRRRARATILKSARIIIGSGSLRTIRAANVLTVETAAACNYQNPNLRIVPSRQSRRGPRAFVVETKFFRRS